MTIAVDWDVKQQKKQNHQEAFVSCIQVQMQLQKLKEGPTIAQTTSSEMLRKALSEKQIKRNGRTVALTSINKKVTYYIVVLCTRTWF